jgi:pantoate kinase
LRGSKGVGVTIESYGKVEISYINVDNFYMDNDRNIKFDIVIVEFVRYCGGHFENGDR